MLQRAFHRTTAARAMATRTALSRVVRASTFSVRRHVQTPTGLAAPTHRPATVRATPRAISTVRVPTAAANAAPFSTTTTASTTPAASAAAATPSAAGLPAGAATLKHQVEEYLNAADRLAHDIIPAVDAREYDRVTRGCRALVNTLVSLLYDPPTPGATQQQRRTTGSAGWTKDEEAQVRALLAHAMWCADATATELFRPHITGDTTGTPQADVGTANALAARLKAVAVYTKSVRPRLSGATADHVAGDAGRNARACQVATCELLDVAARLQRDVAAGGLGAQVGLDPAVTAAEWARRADAAAQDCRTALDAWVRDCVRDAATEQRGAIDAYHARVLAERHAAYRAITEMAGNPDATVVAAPDAAAGVPGGEPLLPAASARLNVGPAVPPFAFRLAHAAAAKVFVAARNAARAGNDGDDGKPDVLTLPWRNARGDVVATITLPTPRSVHAHAAQPASQQLVTALTRRAHFAMHHDDKRSVVHDQRAVLHLLSDHSAAAPRLQQMLDSAPDDSARGRVRVFWTSLDAPRQLLVPAPPEKPLDANGPTPQQLERAKAHAQAATALLGIEYPLSRATTQYDGGADEPDPRRIAHLRDALAHFRVALAPPCDRFVSTPDNRAAQALAHGNLARELQKRDHRACIAQNRVDLDFGEQLEHWLQAMDGTTAALTDACPDPTTRDFWTAFDLTEVSHPTTGRLVVCGGAEDDTALMQRVARSFKRLSSPTLAVYQRMRAAMSLAHVPASTGTTLPIAAQVTSARNQMTLLKKAARDCALLCYMDPRFAHDVACRHFLHHLHVRCGPDQLHLASPIAFDVGMHKAQACLVHGAYAQAQRDVDDCLANIQPLTADDRLRAADLTARIKAAARGGSLPPPPPSSSSSTTSPSAAK